MRRHEDDLTAWQDDPVIRALTGPASAAELAGEADMLAAFRTAVPHRSRRRFAGRLGAGGSAFVVAIGLSGGVAAAAYTHSLPAPIQRVAHGLLSPIGVPAPSTGHSHSSHHHTGSTQAAGGGNGSAPSGPGVTTSPTPGPVTGSTASSASAAAKDPKRHAAKPDGDKPSAKPTLLSSSKPATSPSATPTPTPTPTPSTSDSPSPSPSPSSTETAAPEPASLQAGTLSQQVAAGNTISYAGHLMTSSGDPAPGFRVWVAERMVGEGGFRRIDSAVTDANGNVNFSVGPLSRNVRLRMVAKHGIKSQTVAVTVVPTLSASLTARGASYDVSVYANGGQPGDQMVLQRYNAKTGRWNRVGVSNLDGNESAGFTVPQPKRQMRYRAVLRRSNAHAFASTEFTVSPQS